MFLVGLAHHHWRKQESMIVRLPYLHRFLRIFCLHGRTRRVLVRSSSQQFLVFKSVLLPWQKVSSCVLLLRGQQLSKLDLLSSSAENVQGGVRVGQQCLFLNRCPCLVRKSAAMYWFCESRSISILKQSRLSGRPASATRPPAFTFQKIF